MVSGCRRVFIVRDRSSRLKTTLNREERAKKFVFLFTFFRKKRQPVLISPRRRGKKRRLNSSSDAKRSKFIHDGYVLTGKARGGKKEKRRKGGTDLIPFLPVIRGGIKKGEERPLSSYRFLLPPKRRKKGRKEEENPPIPRGGRNLGPLQWNVNCADVPSEVEGGGEKKV